MMNNILDGAPQFIVIATMIALGIYLSGTAIPGLVSRRRQSTDENLIRDIEQQIFHIKITILFAFVGCWTVILRILAIWFESFSDRDYAHILKYLDLSVLLSVFFVILWLTVTHILVEMQLRRRRRQKVEKG